MSRQRSRLCCSRQASISSSGCPHQWLTNHEAGCAPLATTSTNEHLRFLVAGLITYAVASYMLTAASLSVSPSVLTHFSAGQRRETCAVSARSCRSWIARCSTVSIVQPRVALHVRNSVSRCSTPALACARLYMGASAASRAAQRSRKFSPLGGSTGSVIDMSSDEPRSIVTPARHSSAVIDPSASLSRAPMSALTKSSA
jgi:hypothetical protein